MFVSFILSIDCLNREEIERQMIETSRERLVRIEDDNITKVRLHRSTSLSEASMDTSYRKTSSTGDTSVFRSFSSPSHSTRGTFNLARIGDDFGSEKILEELILEAGNNDVSVFESNDKGIERKDDAHVQDIHVQVIDKVVDNGDDLRSDIPDRGAILSMNVDENTIKQLEEMFGVIHGRPAGMITTCSSVKFKISLRTLMENGLVFS